MTDGAAPSANATSPGDASRLPDAGDGLPTVREIVELPALAAGLPEVLVGDTALEARVRWVHVSDSAGVARLLNGGELLLSTGSGWPTDPAELAGFVNGLVSAGVAGLVLELGVHYRYLPAVIGDAARQAGLALIVLHREVKFVAVTEAVHRLIIAEQTEALRARDEVRERFTELALRGAPADFIVHRLAQTLDAPVVLENLTHEIVAAEAPAGAEDELFAGWERRSRFARPAGAGAESAEGWVIVPVEARGIRWGRVIALPGPGHPAGRSSVLEQGAIALALGRLADGETDDWARIGRERVLDDLLAGRFGGLHAATARVEAAGMPVGGAQLIGLVVTGPGVEAHRADASARALGGRALAAPATGPAAAAPGDERGAAIAVLLSLPPSVPFSDPAATAFVRGVVHEGVERAVLWIGSPGSGLEAGLESLREATDLAHAGEQLEGRSTSGPHLRRVRDRPLMRLVSRLRDDHRLLEHGERVLAPLVEHDQLRGGDLLDVLGAVLAHPANRTAAASASHLSRSVFYQRLAQIEALLGVDLDDGETQTALHLALLVRRSSRR